MIAAEITPLNPHLPHKNRIGESARQYDGNGWAEIRGNPISKVGVFPYLGRSIDARLEPDRIYMVYRPEEELANPETISSFRLVPWVDDHPHTLLGPEEAGRVPAEEKGIHGVIGEDVYFDEGVLYANLKIFSDDLADVISDGKRELSVGYGCRYEISSGIYNGEHYDAIQRGIRGNHIATVTEGRMGPDVAVLDQMKFSLDAQEFKMADKDKDDEKKSMDALLKTVADMKATLDKMCADDEDKEKKDKEASDAEESEKKDREAADKAAKDADEDKEKDKDKSASDAVVKAASDSKAAMDAVVKLTADLETLKQDGVRRVLKEIRQRDELAQQTSAFVGSFDASEMTLAEVAKYGADKLGLKVEAGHEVSALGAYFVGRTPPSKQPTFSHDRKDGSAQTNVIDFYSKAS